MRKHTVIIVLVVIVFGAVILYEFGTSGVSYRTVGEDTPNAATSGTASRPNDALQPAIEVSGECLEQKRERISSTEHKEGSLLVSFGDVGFQKALRVLTTTGELSGSPTEARRSYEDHGWIEITVPPDRLAKVWCALQAKEAVRGVSLNMMFELHQ